MLHKTRGIVFKCTDFSETSVVVQIFTEKFGLQSYLINGVKKPKAKIKQNVLQPLHLLDMVVYHKAAGNIQRVAELRHVPVFQNIPYDIVKSSLAIFINEVLYKSVRQQTADEELFNFLFNSIELLDRIEEGVGIFHLYFLLRLTKYLGFYPDTSNFSAEYFDLMEGCFTNILPHHPLILRSKETSLWAQLLKSSFDTLSFIVIKASEKRVILTAILEYYKIHIEGLIEVKSHQILEEVLN